MVLKRNQFFLLLFAIVIVPFLANKVIWLATSKQITGIMCFTGHGNFGSVLGISSYPVIGFKINKDSVFLKGNVNLDLKRGDIISVRYQKNNPSDALINNFVSIWAETLIYALFPVLILLVLFLMPERMDPIIPRKSKILLGKKPLIIIIPV